MTSFKDTETDNAAWLDDIAWNEAGLMPAVAQDHKTGRILMVAWMNAEALALAQRFGLSLEKTLEVIHGTTATNGQLKINYATKVLTGDTEPGFQIDLAHKDLSLVMTAANAGRVELGGHVDESDRRRNLGRVHRERAAAERPGTVPDQAHARDNHVVREGRVDVEAAAGKG